MQFSELADHAAQVAAMYDRLNLERSGAPWTAEQLALGFAGDVGDLGKLIMAEAGNREIDDHRARLVHEMCDCLWSILTLARRLDIDLEREFPRAMTSLLNNSSKPQNGEQA